MIVIDTQWLRDLGVKAANEKALEKLVELSEAELEFRVGNVIAKHLTDTQIDEFEAIEDEDKHLEWLEKAFPEYKKVTDIEYDKMSKQIQRSVDKTKLIESWV